MLGAKIGNSWERLAELVERINGDTPGHKPFASITLDTAHSLIAVDGDYEELAGKLTRFGHLIRYVHVAYPVFGYAGRLAYATDPRWRRLPKPLLAYVNRSRHLDGHRRTHATPDGAAFDRLVQDVLRRTPAGTFNAINLEVAPRWCYLHQFYKKGCSCREMRMSVEHLEDVLADLEQISERGPS